MELGVVAILTMRLSGKQRFVVGIVAIATAAAVAAAASVDVVASSWRWNCLPILEKIFSQLL